MTRLSLIALMSLTVSVILCYSTLWIAEAITKATTPRIEMALNP